MQRVISAGFATAAVASASVPALAWTVWPDVDFAWYADVGRTVATRDVQFSTAPTAAYGSAMRDERPAQFPVYRDDDRSGGELATDLRALRARHDRTIEPADARAADEAPK
jgi:hypothetical protein